MRSTASVVAGWLNSKATGRRPGWASFALAGLALVALAGPAAAQAPVMDDPTFIANLLAGIPTSGSSTPTARIFFPTAMEFAPDGRLFICQQGGALRVVKNGALLATPFMTLTVSTTGERGLLGIAFDPNFATNNFLYVYYSVPTAPIHNRISRFTANGDIVVPGSESILMDLDSVGTAANHNGGAIHFGPDGKLYVAVGDNTTSANAQSMTTRFGKVLRINSDGSIPTDNPFFGTATGANRAIWALGLRNPFTMQFEPGSSRLYINDVGEASWEEINEGAPGANFGWPTTEGEFNPTTFPTLTNPVYAYSSMITVPECAITAGAFYPSPTINFPDTHEGLYFFADYCVGWIHTYDRNLDSAADFATGLSSPVDLKVGPDGALYVLQRGSDSANGSTGTVYRIDYPPNLVPVIAQEPQDTLVLVDADATFTVVATGGQPLTYQWSRDGTDIVGATSASYTLPAAQLSDSGATFAVHVHNQFGDADSLSAVLTVVDDTPPVATIVNPPVGTLYSAGDAMAYMGTGTDAEDGTEPASRFTWSVVFHHDTHTHPFILPFSGFTSGTFEAIPTSGETSANVFYRIHLTVEDSQGITNEVTRDVLPRTSQVTVTTNPPGLQIKLDSQQQTAPVTFTGVAGIVRPIEAVTPQSLSGTTYAFSSWSDGGAAAHNISTPTTNTTYTANFSVVPPALGVNPTSLAFGDVTLNTTSDKTVTVTNTGGGTLTGGGSVTGTGYSIVGTATYSLTAGQQAVLTVRFAPTVAGSAPGNLTLTGGAGATVPLTGNGVTVAVPSLTIVGGVTTVTPGATVQVQVANGPGFPKDWVTMGVSTAADNVYLLWNYLNGSHTAPVTGVTSATLSFTMPMTLGTYNFRFFQNNGFTKLATSPTVTVASASSPVLGVNPTSLAFGDVTTGQTSDKTVTVTNTGGGTLTGGGSVTGTGYSIVGTATYSLTAGQQAILTVRFAPTATGSAPGNLTLTGAAGATVGLTGNGVVAGAPSLTIVGGVTTVNPGATVQVQVSNGPGFPKDWVTMGASTAADTIYLAWNYLNGSHTAPVTGVTSATLTFTMPTTLGTYNFRFFQNNGFTKLATSPTVTVSNMVNPALGVNPTSLAFGDVTTGQTSDKTVTVTNTGGGTLTGGGSVTGTGYSIVGTATYSLTAGQQAILTVRFAPTATGSAPGQLNLTGSGGATVPLTGNGVAPSGPSLTIVGGVTTVTPGATVQVQVSNGPGFPKDWVTMGASTAADTVYLLWNYLNGSHTAPVTGVTSATLSFTMPMTLGTYNFRFFQNNGFTKLATSPTVTVANASSPVLGVNPTSLAFGNVTTGQTSDKTVTVTNTGGGTLAGGGSVTGTGYSIVGTATYSLTAGQQAILTVRFAPTATGSAPGTLTLTGAAGATVPLTGNGVAASGPSLTIVGGVTTVTPGATVQVQVSNGPGFPKDWVTMGVSTAVDTMYLGWNYLNGSHTAPVTGVTSATLSFTMPMTLGTYNFRFFQNNGYTKLATSPTVTVANASSPVLGVNPTSLAFGDVTTGQTSDKTVTVTNTGGGTLTGGGSVTGTGYSMVGTATYSLTAGQQAVLTVRFAPTATGSAPGNLTLTGAAGATVPLTGNGVAAGAPSLTIVGGVTTVSPGATVQVHVANGPANPKDWVALHISTNADIYYIDWMYLNGLKTIPATGSTSSTLTFTMPMTLGTYNFRFFQNGTYTKLATSPTVTVQ